MEYKVKLMPTTQSNATFCCSTKNNYQRQSIEFTRPLNHFQKLKREKRQREGITNGIGLTNKGSPQQVDGVAKGTTFFTRSGSTVVPRKPTSQCLLYN